MDYTEILKRAWNITWRYRWLWVLGLFAGGGVSGGNSAYQQDMSSTQPFGNLPSIDSAGLLVIMGVAVLVFFISILLFILGVAARGGLISQVDRADGGIAPSLREGWRVGFHFFWRVLGIEVALLAAPVLVLVLAILALLVPVGVTVSQTGTASAAEGLAAGGAVCGLIGFLIVILVPAFIILGVLADLAIRYAVLEDRRWSDAIRTAWGAMRARTGSVAAIWAIRLGVSIALGAVVGGIALVGIMPFFFTAGSALENGTDTAAILTLIVVMLLLAPVLILLSAIASTFMSALWTVFWRRLHGKVADQEVALLHRQVAEAASVGYTAPAPPLPPDYAGPVQGA